MAEGMFWVREGSANGATLQARHRSATLTMARLTHAEESERVFAATRNDAQLAIIQLSPPPRHHFGSARGGRYETGGSPGSFNFADLNAAPVCRVVGRLDSLHLHIPRAALDDLAEDMAAPRIERLRAPDGWQTTDTILDSLRPAMLAALERPEATSQLFIDHLLLAVQAHLAQRYGGLRDAATRRLGGLAPRQLRLARELIGANLTKSASLVEIATACGLSVAHFSRGFKASTGQTPHGWLQHCRVDRAKALLARPDPSLAEIALRCGFADQSHFTRIFLRLSGDTPGAWRRHRGAA